jgi:hypothetical protein
MSSMAQGDCIYSEKLTKIPPRYAFMGKIDMLAHLTIKISIFFDGFSTLVSKK